MQTKEALKPNEDLTSEKQKRHDKQTVVVAGDSVRKYVKGWELSNAERNVSAKSFSGATIGDMSEFLKPTARKQPDKLINIQAQTIYAGQVPQKLLQKFLS